MGRPYQIYENPIMVPYVCIQCGVGAGRREWFLDLGFNIDQYFDVDNNAVYLCNECYHGLTLEVGPLLQKFRKDHEKWNSDEPPSYSWMEEHFVKGTDDVRESVVTRSNSGVGETEQLDAGATSSADRDDQDSEPNDPESEPTDSGDANSTDDSDPNAEGGSLNIKFGST